MSFRLFGAGSHENRLGNRAKEKDAKMDNGEGLKLKEKAKLTTEAYAKRGAC